MSRVPEGFAFWKGLAAALVGIFFATLFLLVGIAVFSPTGTAPAWADGVLYAGVVLMVVGPLWFWVGRPLWYRYGGDQERG